MIEGENIGTCKFCEKEKKLCKAHILPKVFYKEFWEGKTPDIIIYYTKNQRTSKKPVGVYDTNILCPECDGKFGLYDDVAQEFLLRKDWKSFLVKGLNGEGYFIPNTEYDYINLKLFFISLLWRASISENPMFKHVSLGDKLSKRAVEILKNPEKDTEDDFSVIITKYIESSNPELKKIHKVITDPRPFRLEGDGINLYVFLFGGYKILIKADSRKLSQPFDKIILRKDKLMALSVNFDTTKELKMMIKTIN